MICESFERDVREGFLKLTSMGCYTEQAAFETVRAAGLMPPNASSLATLILIRTVALNLLPDAVLYCGDQTGGQDYW